MPLVIHAFGGGWGHTHMHLWESNLYESAVYLVYQHLCFKWFNVFPLINFTLDAVLYKKLVIKIVSSEI